MSLLIVFFLTFSSNTPSHNIRKMALLSKSVIEEPEYHGKGHESTIIYYMLIIPVIYTDLLEAPRFPYQKRFHNKGHLNLATEVLKGFSPGVFNSP